MKADMNELARLLGRETDYGSFRAPSYREVYNTTYEVLWEGRYGDYQGVEVFLLWDGRHFGLTSDSYGSCEVCDPMEACRDYDDLAALIRTMLDRIRWYDDTDDLYSALFPFLTEEIDHWIGDDDARASAHEGIVAAVKEKRNA